VKAWPFLFSRGYVLDHQMIVCPRVMQDARQRAAFRSIVARLADSAMKVPTWDSHIDQQLGRVCIGYITAPAKVKNIDVRDVAGRVVRMVYGVVFLGQTPKREDLAALTDNLMPQVTPSLLADFERFWDQRTRQEPFFSDAIEVTGRSPNVNWALASIISLGGSLAIAILGVALLYHRADSLSAQLKAETERYDSLAAENQKLKSQPPATAPCDCPSTKPD
jgi:hypothetical protein